MSVVSNIPGSAATLIPKPPRKRHRAYLRRSPSRFETKASSAVQSLHAGGIPSVRKRHTLTEILSSTEKVSFWPEAEVP
jgi:hypothetical protein